MRVSTNIDTDIDFDLDLEEVAEQVVDSRAFEDAVAYAIDRKIVDAIADNIDADDLVRDARSTVESIIDGYLGDAVNDAICEEGVFRRLQALEEGEQSVDNLREELQEAQRRIVNLEDILNRFGAAIDAFLPSSTAGTPVTYSVTTVPSDDLGPYDATAECNGQYHCASGGDDGCYVHTEASCPKHGTPTTTLFDGSWYSLRD